MSNNQPGPGKAQKSKRIEVHPVLPVAEFEPITFYWNRTPLQARDGEAISAALMANDIHVFSRHARDGGAQGIYCANGQCAKCTVIANGKPVKSCMTPVRANMIVEELNGLPELPPVDQQPQLQETIPLEKTEVLVIGGGPAGLSAALELGRLGIKTLIIDDKHILGGKLVLQTHKFFGSVEDSQAGTRGNEIGRRLSREVEACPSVSIWLNSTVLYVFKDRRVGVLAEDGYRLVEAAVILNTAGAREKFLRFPGNNLVGIYGAGAFQTLVNRDLVRTSNRLFIVGGGNVGLIAGYHALQAGITVVGLAEAMPACGGYKVHADKLKRLGVPIYTSHTVTEAHGRDRLEAVTIAEIDRCFQVKPGTEKTFACDTLLIAVGLDSINEFTRQAETAGLPVFSSGDAEEIAEASSAMFNGRISGLKIASFLGRSDQEIPQAWYRKAEALKAHPGKVHPQVFPQAEQGVMPIIHCLQEIPCNPCTTVCPTEAIKIAGDPLMDLPEFKGRCLGCTKCLTICPGLAITLVDYRRDPARPEVTVVYEISNHPVKKGDLLDAVDIEGNFLDRVEVSAVQEVKAGLTQLVRFKADPKTAKRIVSFRIQAEADTAPLKNSIKPAEKANENYICLCERVTVEEVRRLIRSGITDFNQIKAITRAGMGSCGAKTCETMIRNLFREEGIPLDRITPNTKRPLFVEVPLGVFAGMDQGEQDHGKKS